MRPRSIVFAPAVVLVALSFTPGRASGYWLDGPKWRSASANMHTILYSPSRTLDDGSTTWGQPVEAAMAIWNQYMDTFQFRITRDSSAPVAGNNGYNNVFWSSTIYGRTFAPYAGYTLWWSSGGAIVEADVIFNNQLTYNSYRGSTRSGVIDIRRLALHELGHAVGLNHPDDHGQSVVAQMNSRLSNLDTLAADDISAAQALYSYGGTGSVAFPPRNESLDFRDRLEALYRDVLQGGNQPTRASQLTYVDREGDIVWLSEYFRYRVNACSHSQANTRVMAQIDNQGTYGVCGAVSSSSVAFPPRNESLAFRQTLEAKYRDELRRSPVQTYVDNEGDVVWIQEYLRYRVNGCSHAVAIDKVFAQISGRGVQPVCR
jgi:hypothetical protein